MRFLLGSTGYKTLKFFVMKDAAETSTVLAEVEPGHRVIVSIKTQSKDDLVDFEFDIDEQTVTLWTSPVCEVSIAPEESIRHQ